MPLLEGSFSSMSESMVMSQYIDSLKKRAREFETERATIQARMTKDAARLHDLNGAISGIETLLRVEGAAPESPTPPGGSPPHGQASASSDADTGPKLYDVIQDVMADFKPRTEHELIGVAKQRGVNFGDKEPRRTVAFTLMGIARGKKIQRVKDDVWRRVA